MATYLEIFTLESDATLLQRTNTAVLIAAVTVYEESAATINHDRRVLWARAVNLDINTAAAAMLKFLLAKFNASTVAVIQATTDAQLQSAVNVAVDLFAKGF
jgi:hypothetical protein